MMITVKELIFLTVFGVIAGSAIAMEQPSEPESTDFVLTTTSSSDGK